MIFHNQSSVFLVAELSANHCGDYNIAVETIHAAKAAGFDAIKVQTYTADTMTLNIDNDIFRISGGTLWDGRTLYNLYEEAHMPWKWQPALKKIAEELEMTFFSTPFDKTAVDFLEEMDTPLYKIASFEITDIPLIHLVASKGKPIIISTGIATLGEIEEAVQTCRNTGNEQITLMQCTSAYPASPEEVNLATMIDMRERFNVSVGLSDHTLGATAAISAVALGAQIIEKHFILDKTIGGPDAAFSIDPHEATVMISMIREAEKMRGIAHYTTSQGRTFARSLFITSDMKEGDIFTEENLRSLRPGNGLPPKYFNEIVGKRASRQISRGTPLTWEMICL